jgi:GST-like protein
VDKPYVVYGGLRTGSVPVEATLLLLGVPYEVVESEALDNRSSDATLAKINPMRQVPALALPSRELMTESAAILTYLADLHPQDRLAPGVREPRRPQFLRWMNFVSSQIYSQYWARDDLSRLAADKAHEAVIKERTAERIAECWRRMDAQVSPGLYLLGDELGVLDLYVAVVSRWGPRRPRFYLEAPKMAEVVRRVDAEPRLLAFWAERFPFED